MAQSVYSKPNLCDSQIGMPSNRIAYFSKAPSSSVGNIILDKANIDHIVKHILIHNPGLESLPLQIVSVLGGNDQNQLRQFYTDWLIEFIVRCGDVQKCISQRPINFSGENELQYVNNSGSEKGTGVYIWPSPLIVTCGEKKKSTLLWIIYATQPEGQNNNWDDIFTACISTKVVYFDTLEKEYFLKSKAIMGDELSDTHIIKAPTMKTIGSMGTFLRQLECSIQCPCTDSSRTVTLGNLAEHLEAISDVANAYIKNRQQQLCQTNNIPPVAPIPYAKIRAQSGTKAAHSIANITSPPEESSVCSDPKYPCDLLNCDEKVTKVSKGVNAWIEKNMTLQNSETLKDVVANYLESPVKWQGIYEDVIVVQDHIDSLHTNFKNMYDNYVCFDGKVDQNQMLRFSGTYCQHSNNGWKTKMLRHPNHFTWDHIHNAYKKLHHLFVEENNKIIQHETRILKEAGTKALTAYQGQLQIFINKKAKEDFNYWASELVEYNQKLQAYCIVMIGRSLDYGGKLNIVVRNHIDVIRASFDQIFEEITKPLKDSSKVKSPQWQVQYNLYVKEIQQIFKGHLAHNTFYPDTLKLEHDRLLRVVTKDMGTSENAEFRLILDCLFINMVENELVKLETIKKMGRELPYDAISIYITNEFIYAYCTQSGIGTSQLTFPTSHSRNPSDFGHLQTEVCVTRGNEVEYGYTLNFMTDHQKKIKFSYAHKFLDYFDIPSMPYQTLKIMASKVISDLKNTLERSCKTDFSRINIIMSGWLSVEHRLLIKQECKALGFQHAFVLPESTISAWKYFNASTRSDDLLLVVIARKVGIRLEIYGKQQCQPVGDGAVSAKLVAVSYEQWSQENTGDLPSANNFVETLKATYGRVLSQLPARQRNGIKKYVCLADYPKCNQLLDSYLTNMENMVKEIRLTNDSIAPILMDCVNNDTQFKGFLLGLSIPNMCQENHAEWGNVEQLHQQHIPQRNKKLLERCNNMERQLDDGFVRVGSLRKKIILKAIQKGKVAAEENIIQNEEKEIDDLCKQYSFQV